MCTVGWIVSLWLSVYAHWSGTAYEFLLNEGKLTIARTHASAGGSPGELTPTASPPFSFPHILRWTVGQGYATPLHWETSETTTIDIPMWSIAFVAWAGFVFDRSVGHLRGRKERFCIQCGTSLSNRSDLSRCPVCGRSTVPTAD
jgi:hypothetical protein